MKKEQEPLEIVEMPIHITKVPAILAPDYEHLSTKHQCVIQIGAILATETYLHNKKMLFVGTGIDDRYWFTYYRRVDQKKRYRRFVSKYLPLRNTSAEAERDLEAFAKKNGCVKI